MNCPHKDQIYITFNEVNKLKIGTCCHTFPKDVSLYDFFKIKKFDDLGIKTLERTPVGAEVCKGIECPTSEMTSIDLSGAYKCNLNCFNCYHTVHKDTKKHINLYFLILDHLSEMNIGGSLCLDGSGEILLYYKKFKQFLLNQTPKNFTQISIITNASYLTEKMIKELNDISISTGVEYLFIVSLDGITKETFESIRIGACFETVIKNIDELSKYFSMRINFTLKKDNYKEAYKLKDYLIENFTFYKGVDIGYGYDFYDNSLLKYCEDLQKQRCSIMHYEEDGQIKVKIKDIL